MTGDRVLTFDLETADAADLWRYGPGFVRLAGYAWGSSPPEVTTDIASLVEMMGHAELVVGHNITSFDLLALARYHGLDLASVSGRVVDTMLVERQWDPPEARSSSAVAARRLDLDSIGERRELGHKTFDLKKLARSHGGLDQIPTDDPDYVAYAKGDVELTRALDTQQGEDAWRDYGDYLNREHQIALIAAQMMLVGFRVDLDLLEERAQAMDQRKSEAYAELARSWGIPVESAAPLRTKKGQAALEEALASVGIEDPPTTPTGKLKTGEDDFLALLEDYPEASGLLKLCVEAVGGREIYPLVAKHAVGDRVHPSISMKQASGRWSVTSPALTTLGKRDGRVVEREVFLPEPGHVMLCVDLSQVDMRAVAGLCGDTKYAKLFEPGRDAHGIIAGLCWGGPLDKTNPHREVAKTIAHGWNYGRGTKAIGRVPGVGMDRALRFGAIMSRIFPDLVQWKEDIRREARETGILDNGWGRRMRVTQGREYTQAPALMGQGAARDIMMEGLLRLPEEVRPWLRGVIHDEVVMSVPEDVVWDVEREVRQALSFEWRGVPIVADEGDTGPSWGEVYRKSGQPRPEPAPSPPPTAEKDEEYPEGSSQPEETDAVETSPLSMMEDTAIEAYQREGFTDLLPLETGSKGPPPTGYTGREGRSPSELDIRQWLEERAYGNLALRLPPGLVGLDVDHYGAKRGGETLEDLERRLGQLPDAPTSSARPDPSGIRLYQVPADWEGVTSGGDGLDIIQWFHRYLVVWPSVHPSGEQYAWRSCEGPVPRWREIPVLPLSWAAWLRKVREEGSGAHSGLSARAKRGLLEAMPSPQEPCRSVKTALRQAGHELAEKGARHDNIRDRVLDLVRMGEEGHHGVPRALAALRTGFIRAVTPDRPSEGMARDEYQRMLDGALEIVAASPSSGPPSCCDTPPASEGVAYLRSLDSKDG